MEYSDSLKLDTLKIYEKYWRGDLSLYQYLDALDALNVHWYPKLLDQINNNIITINDGLSKQVLTSVMMLTCRPSVDIPFAELKSKTHRFLTKYKKITNALYSYEQTGTTKETLGNGHHLHLIFSHEYKNISLLKRDIITNFKSLHTGMKFDSTSTLAFGCLHLADFQKDQDLPNRIEYITGLKENTEKDPNKQLKQQYDKEWRKNHGLLDYYGNLEIIKNSFKKIE